jgi:hypothetical protein
MMFLKVSGRVSLELICGSCALLNLSDFQTHNSDCHLFKS